MITEFREILSEIATSGLTVDPDGGTEPNANLCTISLSRAQADALTPTDVASFLHQAADAYDLHRRQSDSPEASMVFYTWVDQMAGQLRFSVVSALPLSFACPTRIIADPLAIAQDWLACPYLDGIPFSAFETVDTSDMSPNILNVCVIHLPRCDA